MDREQYLEYAVYMWASSNHDYKVSVLCYFITFFFVVQ